MNKTLITIHVCFDGYNYVRSYTTFEEFKKAFEPYFIFFIVADAVITSPIKEDDMNEFYAQLFEDLKKLINWDCVGYHNTVNLGDIKKILIDNLREFNINKLILNGNYLDSEIPEIEVNDLSELPMSVASAFDYYLQNFYEELIKPINSDETQCTDCGLTIEWVNTYYCNVYIQNLS